VDNTVGQDWENVQRSLVAGAPQSFVQNLSQPYYSRRPELGMPDSASISLKTYQATLTPGREFNRLEQLASLQPGVITFEGRTATLQTESASEAAVRSESRNVGSGAILGTRAEVDSGTARRGKVAAPLSISPTSSNLVDANYSLPAWAAARELGEPVRIQVKDPITIRKNNSAMVPILQAEIAAEKVSIWNEPVNLPWPTRALWRTNTSGLTLDGGASASWKTIPSLGEGVFEPIRPEERRLVSYALDLALNASSKNTAGVQRVTHVRIFKSVMTQEGEMPSARPMHSATRTPPRVRWSSNTR
jgi:hypothetical protein